MLEFPEEMLKHFAWYQAEHILDILLMIPCSGTHWKYLVYILTWLTEAAFTYQLSFKVLINDVLYWWFTIAKFMFSELINETFTFVKIKK